MTTSYSTEEIRVGNERLLELAGVLDTADERHVAAGEPTYYQVDEYHRCGTPACAGGHWNHHVQVTRGREAREDLDFWDRTVFALDAEEWDSIFSANAPHMTAKEAATFIREFVARRQS